MASSSRRYRSYRRQQRRNGGVSRILKFVLLIFLAYLVVDSLFLRSYKIGSASMEPALAIGDRILTSPIVYGIRLPFGKATLPGFGKISRGDIAVVEPRYLTQTAWQEMGAPLIDFFTFQRNSPRTASGGSFTTGPVVKRVVALPGDTVSMVNNTIWVTPAGSSRLAEEFAVSLQAYSVVLPDYPDGWTQALPFSGNQEAIELTERQYFVVSDDRGSTHDSRYWGPVDEAAIKAKVLFRYWPFDAFGSP